MKVELNILCVLKHWCYYLHQLIVMFPSQPPNPKIIIITVWYLLLIFQDHYHPCSNPGVGISDGCFVFHFVSLPLEVARPILPTLCAQKWPEISQLHHSSHTRIEHVWHNIPMWTILLQNDVLLVSPSSFNPNIKYLCYWKQVVMSQ